jgi:hypothetical protein
MAWIMDCRQQKPAKESFAYWKLRCS